MELLTEETTLKGLLIAIITSLIYALRVLRKDVSKEKEEKERVLVESQKNLSWYQQALDRYQSTIDRMLDK